MRAFRLPTLVACGFFLAASPAVAGPEDIDHYLCYRVTAYDGPADIPVKLRDQFGEMQLHAAKPTMLCNPVDKNGEGIHDREAHLLCYSVNEVEGAPGERKVETETQFGKTKLTLKGLATFCVPSSKKLLKP
jgi:hypothetical protein